MRFFIYKTLLLAMLAVTTAHAQVADGEVRIGILTDMHSIYSDFAGPGLVSAVEMAIRDAGGEAAGAPVRIYVHDTELQVDRTLELAEELKHEHNVDMITGIVGSDEALALQAWGHENKVITLNSVSATANLTGQNCSPYGVHWTYDTWAVSAGTANAIVREGGKTWYLIVADYAFGHAMSEQAAAAVIEAGGEVVGQTLVPYRGEDFTDAPMTAAQPADQCPAISTDQRGLHRLHGH